jgi:hypothetical protein
MDEKRFTAIVIATFNSDGEYGIFVEKLKEFNSDRVVKHLKANGQISLSLNRIIEDELIRIATIWQYKNEKSWKECQKLWSKFTGIGPNYIVKRSRFIGEEIFSWN